jgi:hypothetical protein
VVKLTLDLGEATEPDTDVGGLGHAESGQFEDGTYCLLVVN